MNIFATMFAISDGGTGVNGPVGILGLVVAGAWIVAGIIWLVNRKELEQINRDAKSKHKSLEVVGAQWTCAKCGETNPPQFDLCWKCRTLKKIT